MNNTNKSTRENAISELSRILGLPEGEIDPYTVNNYLEENEELCPDCGNTPDEGACFFCKMD